jgi:hypothetical protein
MEAAYFSEKSVNIYQITRRLIPESSFILYISSAISMGRWSRTYAETKQYSLDFQVLNSYFLLYLAPYNGHSSETTYRHAVSNR